MVADAFDFSDRIDRGIPPTLKAVAGDGRGVFDSISAQALAEDYEGVTGTRRILAGDDIPPCSGWLFTYQFTIPGVSSTEQLELIFVSDEGAVSVDIGRSLVTRGYPFDSDETDVEPSEIPDNLDRIKSLAAQFATCRRKEIQRQAEEQAAGRVDAEVSRLASWFDYRERAAKDRVESTQTILNRIRESGDESQRQILPVWEANLRRDKEVLRNLMPERSSRIAEAERHRYPQVAWSLKSLGRIEVVAAEGDDDPDAGLELRDGIRAELKALLAESDSSITSSAEEVARRQGLSW